MVMAWSVFIPDVLPHVAGCPVALAKHEIKRAAQAFFQGSRAWQVTLPTPFAVAADQSEVTIATGSVEYDLVRVEKAWFDGRPLDVVTADVLDQSFGDDWQSHTGTPSLVVQNTPSVVRLYPVPTDAAATGIKCRVSVKPAETATGIPDDMYVRFKDAIITGAKSRLMLYPEKTSPFADPKMGMALSSAFDVMVSNARLAAARAYGRGRIPSTPSWC